MNIIGLNTTTHSFCLGFIQNEEGLDRIVIEDKGYRSEEFLNYLEKILRKHNLTKTEINGYVISIGPGSLTGIRVGLAFLKGIGFSTGKPIVPVKTLYAIAYEFRSSKEYICPILLAKKNKVFCALYRFGSGGSGSILRRSPDVQKSNRNAGEKLIEQTCAKIEELLDLLPKEKVLFVGNGAEAYKKEIIARCGEKASFIRKIINHPDPVVVARIGLEKIKNGDIPPLDSLEPIYL